MKKTLVSLLSLLALSNLFTLTSCQKEQMGDGTQFRATMEVCTDQNGKTALNGTALNWVEGDQIVVYGTEGNGLYRATPQTPATVAVFNNVSGTVGNAPFRAYYPSTLTTDGVHVTLPAVQTTPDGSLTGFPMYAQSNDDQLAFKNLCGALKLHLTKADVSVSSIEVTANTNINGQYLLRYTGVPVIYYESDGSNSTMLQCETPQSIANGKDFYIYMPHGNYTDVEFTITATDGSVCTKRSKADVAIYITRSQYTTVNLGENDLDFVNPQPEGALPGLFTINADGDQIRFSKGNLQYQASTTTWRFAENQYDYVGGGAGSQHYECFTGNVYENGDMCMNDYIGSGYAGWIDLFGWGTGNNPTLHTENYADYATFVDWGVNAISNGGNAVNSGWRTLTHAEWSYLIENHPYGTGNINGVSGLIILPDNWTLPVGCSFSSGLTESWGDWSLNNYTLSQWVVMEDAGAVFLPAAGFRYGTNIANTQNNMYLGGYSNTTGRYWSSTDDWVLAYYLEFNNELNTNYIAWPEEGFSVRLVQDND